MMKNFNREDASQIAIGAFALAVPISFSEEAWILGESLPALNICLLLILSVTFLSFFAYESVFRGDIKFRVMFLFFGSLLLMPSQALLSLWCCFH